MIEVLGGVQVEHAIARAQWTDEGGGRWSTPLPGGAFAYGLPGFLRLSAPGLDLRTGAEAGKSSFVLEHGRIHVALGQGEPPESVALVQRMEHGAAGTDARWQLRVGNDFGTGIPVWSDGPEELVCDVPAASRISFTACWLSRSEPAPVTFRVRLDGELVHEAVLAPADFLRGAFQSAVLPPAARKRARLAFEVAGPPGLGILARPTLGPAEIGVYGARPWPAARPDVVLFLADTFRADNLGAYGGSGELAPHLERFAAGARCFAEARSNAAWTLPSVASLLTGLAPGQHTANDSPNPLPKEVETVCEALAHAGYRVGAVTDAGYFTAFHGLDQGCELFAQHHSTEWNLDRTVAQALQFLAADDGRPVFLIVHTYRAHLPYRVGPEEDHSQWDALAKAYPVLAREGKTDEEHARLLAESRASYRELYQAGVRDLDRGFGDFFGGLERLGLAQHGWLVFTSDHGEALGEHDDIFHGGDLWEVKLRIPLLVRGPGLAPGRVDLPVTLLDFAPTLFALAGLEPDPDWAGTSLLTVDHARPSWAFRLQKRRQVALIDGARKLLTRQDKAFASGGCELAYDLSTDPGETENQAAAPWAKELARQHAPELGPLLAPLVEELNVEPSGALQHELKGIGYGGDDEGDEAHPEGTSGGEPGAAPH